MGLKDTIKSMNEHLEQILADLKKSERGNKAAAQRVRTHTIKFAKISKRYRQESIEDEKKMKKKVVKAVRKTNKKNPKRKK
ncbi:MAG: hypothetical protein WCT85_07030 [Parachlamydiales bacterium]|jgi:hypothetical protein